jgi:hypothetical protein
MFDNYGKPDLYNYTNICDHGDHKTRYFGNLKNLYDKKQRFYGVEAKYLMPFDLYFNLIEAEGQPLEQFLTECSIELSICTKPAGKPVITKVFSSKDVFNALTSDIKISITQEEASQLHQETYSIILKLIHSTGVYLVHTERDKVLVVR